MGLIPKCPVDKPCEAESFDEAARKNRVRLSFERDQAKDLREEMSKDHPCLEGIDPAFWEGAIAINESAYKIFQDEQKVMLQRVAQRLGALSKAPIPGTVYQSGWNSIRESWVKALKQNDPSFIVYW